MSQVKGFIPQDCPHFRIQTQVQVVTSAPDQRAITQRGSHNSTLDLINWLQQFPGLGETFDLLDLIFITHEEPDGRCLGQGMGSGQGAARASPGTTFSTAAGLHQPGSSPSPVLWSLCGGFIKWAGLINPWPLADELNLQPPSLPWRLGVKETEDSKSNHTLVLLASSSSLGYLEAFQT